MHSVEIMFIQELVSALETSNLSTAEISKAKQGLHTDYPLGIAQCGADALRFTMCAYDFTGTYLVLSFRYLLIRAES